MVAYTPFLRLSKPPFDDIPWDDAVNGNMDILDAFVSLYMAVPNFTGVWTNSTAYVVGQNALDVSVNLIYTCLVTHTSAEVPSTFAADRVAHSTYWSQTIPSAPIVAPTYHDVGRNRIINGGFDVFQRGTGSFSATGYTADRWYLDVVGGTCSMVVQSQDEVSRVQIGDESSEFCASFVFVGGSAAPDYLDFNQYIEGVNKLAGKEVTVSFWAAGDPGKKLGVNIYQYMGVGGTGSDWVVTPGQNVTLQDAWRRYSVTFQIPIIGTRVVGTGPLTALTFFLSSGADYNVRAGNIGVQSASVALWGVQLEVGSSASLFEVVDTASTVVKCMRYYQKYFALNITGYCVAAAGLVLDLGHTDYMIRPPTVTTIPGFQSNVTDYGLDEAYENHTKFYVTAAATGMVICMFDAELDAELYI